MNVITKLMYSIHRILGTLLCILFLMWFLSAFVMMYHRFPRVNTKEKLQKQEVLSASGDSLPDIADVIARLPHKEQVRKLTLNRKFGQIFFHVRTGKGEYDLPLNPSDSLLPTDSRYIHRIAALWCSAPIARIDTVNSPDQWIPFGELKKEMPIYKIYFADDAGTQLYLSSRNGEALQFSNRNERFWAWLGAIPHWVYFHLAATRHCPMEQDGHLAVRHGLRDGHCRYLGNYRCMAEDTPQSLSPLFTLPQEMVSLALSDRNIFRNIRTDLYFQRHDVRS